MQAILIFKDKYVYSDGAIREMVIWQLPVNNIERPHGFKYRLFYGYGGECFVRYDNERGKGDHRHYCNDEESYCWVSVQQLVKDFNSDLERLRGI